MFFCWKRNLAVSFAGQEMNEMEICLKLLLGAQTFSNELTEDKEEGKSAFKCLTRKSGEKSGENRHLLLRLNFRVVFPLCRSNFLLTQSLFSSLLANLRPPSLSC